MTAPILNGADWQVIGCFAFVFLAAIGALIRLCRRKPAPPTPLQTAFSSLKDDRMRAHRHELAKYFGQKFGQN